MTGLTIVEWGGGGTGFSLFERPGRPRPPAPFIAAAQSLIRYPVVQPDERTGDPERFPIWCLVHVDVEDYGPHWCFTVQGRDGNFGRSGSCQFLFAGADHDPSSLWLRGIRRIGTDGRLCHEAQREIPFFMPGADRLEHPLAALLAGQDHLPLAGDPLDVAATITALLCVLPLAVIRSRIWATFLLKQPVLEDKAVASGHWPAELAGNPSARGIRDWLGDLPEAPRYDERVAEALRWIARRAAKATILSDYRDQPDMVSFVDSVVKDELGIRVQDIPSLLDSGSAILGTPKAAPVITEWARIDPDAAIRYLVPPRLPIYQAELVFEGVLQAHLEAGDGANPARFPPAGEGLPGWHDVLAAALKHRLRTKKERIAFVRDELLAKGRPLAKPGAVERAASWLRKIDVSPDDETITIFPVSVDAIAATLRRPHGTLTARQRAFLRDLEDPRAVCRQIHGRLRYLDPFAADQLLGTLPDREHRLWFLSEIVARNWLDNAPLSACDWAVELTSLRRKDAVVIVEGMYGYLADHGELSDDLLDAALRVYADQPETTATQRTLLIEAGARLARRSAVVPDRRDFGPRAKVSTVEYYDDYEQPVTYASTQHWDNRGSASESSPPASEQPEYVDTYSPPPLGFLAAQVVVGVVIVVFVIFTLIDRLG